MTFQTVPTINRYIEGVYNLVAHKLHLVCTAAVLTTILRTIFMLHNHYYPKLQLIYF